MGHCRVDYQLRGLERKGQGLAPDLISVNPGLEIIVAPVALGAGRALFAGLPRPIELELAAVPVRLP